MRLDQNLSPELLPVPPARLLDRPLVACPPRFSKSNGCEGQALHRSPLDAVAGRGDQRRSRSHAEKRASGGYPGGSVVFLAETGEKACLKRVRDAFHRESEVSLCLKTPPKIVDPPQEEWGIKGVEGGF